MIDSIAVGAERQMAYYDGKVAAGRKLLQSQIETLQSTGVKVRASDYTNETAIHESLVGNVDWARKTALQMTSFTQGAEQQGVSGAGAGGRQRPSSAEAR